MLEPLSLVERLHRELLASRSATRTLQQWCGKHRLATGAVITTRRIHGAPKRAAAEQRQRLQVGPAEVIKHRRVQLVCGDRVLSEADNWYVPGRLTAEMNHVLDTSDTPFGRVVLALAPYRETFAAHMLWSPLASLLPIKRWIPERLFEHRAVVYTDDGVPISEVDEVYQRQVLPDRCLRPRTPRPLLVTVETAYC